jgi:hypothetical protein
MKVKKRAGNFSSGAVTIKTTKSKISVIFKVSFSKQYGNIPPHKQYLKTKIHGQLCAVANSNETSELHYFHVHKDDEVN